MPKSTSRACRTQEIVASLRTPLSTTSQIPELLRTLLGLDISNPSVKTASKVTTSAKISRLTSTERSKKSTKPRKGQDFAIHEDEDDTVAALPVTARYKLATESFNAALRTLSESAKKRQHDGADGKAFRREESANRRASGAENSSQKCVSVCKAGSSRLAHDNAKVNEDFEAVAMCACIALNWLNLNKSGTDEIRQQQKSSDTERGSLVLLDKLVTLGLSDLALLQISQIYVQHVHHPRPITQQSIQPQTLGSSNGLSNFVAFKHEARNEAEFNFMASYHTQVLRLAILLGPNALVGPFVESIRLSETGSPANVVWRAHAAGLIKNEIAASQLRIISQALLKLYSDATKSAFPSQSRVATFCLLVQALVIKIKSWQLVKHKPTLDRDLWSHVHRSVKRLKVSSKTCNRPLYDQVKSEIDLVRNTLKESGYEAEPPHKICRHLAILAEESGSFIDALHFLESKNDQSQLEPAALVLDSWSIVIVTQRSSRKRNKNLLRCLESAGNSFQLCPRISPSDRHEVLNSAARLRKAVCSIAMDTNQAHIDNKSTIVDNEVRDICLRILVNLLDLLQLTTNDQETDDTNMSKEEHRFNLTNVTKTIEAILNVLANVSQIAHPDAIMSAAFEALQKIFNHLGNTPTPVSDDSWLMSLHRLAIRVSNLFWTRYVGLDGQSPSHEDSIRYLQQSISALTYLSGDLQYEASMGMKLERLALLYIKTKDLELAHRKFEKAINHYIAVGALDEAVQFSTKEPYQMAWTQKGSKRSALELVLLSHTKLCLTHDLISATSGSWLYDDGNLSGLQRSLLLAKQILISADQPFNHLQARTLLDCAEEILSWDVTCISFKSRLCLEMLKVASKHPSYPGVKILKDDLVTNLCSSIHQTNRLGEGQQGYRQWLASSLQIQWNLHNGTMDLNILRSHTNAICSLITQSTEAKAFASIAGDVNFALRQVQAVLSHARMFDDPQFQIRCIAALKHASSLLQSSSTDFIFDLDSQLATIFARLGEHAKAESTFDTALARIRCIELPSYATIRLKLAYADYHVGRNDMKKAETVLYDAYTMFSTISEPTKSLPGRQRLERDGLVSYAAKITSELALYRGDLSLAMAYARQSVKVSTSIWQALEQAPSTTGAAKSATGVGNISLHSLTQDMSSLSISSEPTLAGVSSRGTHFWNHAHLHFAALLHIGKVSAHCGHYQDTLYYWGQYQKATQAIGATVWTRRADPCMALLNAKANQDMSSVAMMPLSDLEQPLLMEDFQAMLFQVKAMSVVGHLKEARSLLTALRSMATDPHDSITTEEVSKQPTRKPALRGRAKKAHPIKAPPKHPSMVPTSAAESRAVVKVGNDRSPGNVREVDLFESRLELALAENDFEAIRSQCLAIDDSYNQSLVQKLCMAISLLHSALQELASDAVKCVLAETAIALPVKCRPKRVSGRVSFIQAAEVSGRAGRQPTMRGKKSAQKVAEGKIVSVGERMLLDAHKLLGEIQQSSHTQCSSEFLHMLAKVRTKAALLTSTMESPFSLSSFDIVMESLLAKDIAMQRERMTISAERATNSKDRVLTWPHRSDQQVDQNVSNTAESATFLLDDLPQSWSVISISLADDQRELLVSRMLADESPFMLRIPLSRTDELSDEDEFTFQEAKSELDDIVQQANASCHDPRGQGDKTTRREWYSEREELDQRLGALLGNIENVWLGGFRGVMSPHRVDETMLSTFEQALTHSLGQHLPSRQKSSKGSKLELHGHVLELFLGLGHPDECEVDDAITDLLYFVVDILQFNDERNAYDEIDFDAILVDVIDALRLYHEQLSQSTTLPQHTILILDKELAAFPWESLPCLQKQSVTRMPSLGALVERLQTVRKQDTESQGYTLPLKQGAYMLNPSSDLVSTETTLHPILQSNLTSFTSTVRKPPTESDFESVLRDNDLFLYFGHGSGAQYIRGRTIRALDSCAVTLLMGCSSAKMTECGKFESYGTPGYYINGTSGCMAVVGTLWDVTDRDIDRFAVKLMLEWGLVVEDDAVVRALERSSRKTSALAKNKGKASAKGKAGTSADNNGSVNPNRGKVSLDEAVNRGREACLLKYLNGAAPVIYGVPVFLEQ